MGELCTSLLKIKFECVFQAPGASCFFFYIPSQCSLLTISWVITDCNIQSVSAAESVTAGVRPLQKRTDIEAKQVQQVRLPHLYTKHSSFLNYNEKLKHLKIEMSDAHYLVYWRNWHQLIMLSPSMNVFMTLLWSSTRLCHYRQVSLRLTWLIEASSL